VVRPASIGLTDTFRELTGSPATLTVGAVIARETGIGHRLAENGIENAALVRARQLSKELKKIIQHGSSPIKSLIEGLSANGPPFISGV
jgi:hypothetical protein